ncbi:MAG: amino acid racemase [Mitsuaria chitosanitabida]|uniref:aspartate/glutamate racemase family protein n=1 Tax=Roseateles chitosanitabidus TaxID=65048 RepID=UPI001B2E85DC|nr:amino acid racemase [Roseateles chitosanitabidus]MBO9685283.1 amino acid racemase [Roseateles chitosanitabidus]
MKPAGLRRTWHESKIIHLGIVACSAEGAALCYRTICAEGAAFMGPHAHPEISMHTPSLHLYVEALEQGDRATVAALMLASAHKLKAAGAQLLLCPDNTIHQAFDLVEPHSPLPWLHIARVVADEARTKGFRRIGILGTKWLVDSDVYPDALAAAGLEGIKPTDAWRDELGALIMNELVPGTLRAGTVERFQLAIDALRDRGCDAVVLGCTEIPLIISDANSSLPTLDSTRLLARAALRASIQGFAQG